MKEPLAGRGTRPLRIVVAHCRYQSRGGEDAVVEAETALLRNAGHEVLSYERDNHDLEKMGALSAAVQTFWSARTVSDVSQIFATLRPDILHVHNTFPLISPSIYWAAHRSRVPVIQTLHNFRLLCPQGLMLRDDIPCEACVGRIPINAIRHGCYRGSRPQSAVLSSMLITHRAAGTWHKRVDRFIALNEFCRRKFVEGGLPANRVVVKPNFVDLPLPPIGAVRTGFLFVGRLSREKGISVLAQAAALAQQRETISVAGEGPEQEALQGIPDVVLLGALTPSAVYAKMNMARALILPSIWYENFPRTLVEAFACGLPVIASRLGAMATLIDEGVNGLLFEPGDPQDLASKLDWCAAHPHEMARMGRAARSTYEEQLTPEANLAQLQGIYADCIEASTTWQP